MIDLMVCVFSPSTWSMTRSSSLSGSGSSYSLFSPVSTWFSGRNQSDRIYCSNWDFRICTLTSSRLRTNYLRTVSPSLSIRTFEYLRRQVCFGDWLLLIMISAHLDIKLFTDILAEIGIALIIKQNNKLVLIFMLKSDSSEQISIQLQSIKKYIWSAEGSWLKNS